MTVLLISLGLGISGAALSAILWSIVRPERRIWPPETYGRWTLVLVWVPTFALFGIIVALGILEWGQIGLPAWLRFGIGIPLIVIGNIAVLYEASKFGIDQTSGAKGAL